MSQRQLIIAFALACACLPSFAQGGPGHFEGLWCGTGLLGDFSLELRQNTSQDAEGTLTRKGRVRHIHGQVYGNRVQTENSRHGSLTLEVKGDKLRIVDGTGALMLTRGGSFVRSLGSSCG
jgi:hypothetical protein